MPLPTYDRFMLPLLRMAVDGQGFTLQTALERMAVEFGLTDEDRKQLLPSGTEPVINNRVRWARTYLRKAGLLEQGPNRSYRITARGRTVLAAAPPFIDEKFLRQFPEFLAFKVPSKRAETAAVPELGQPGKGDNPLESLEASYLALRRELAGELLERLKSVSPRFFEALVVDLLVAMGYGGSRQDAGRAVGRSGDDGVDGIIKEDRLGLDAVYIQAKRWAAPVGRPEVQGV